MDGLYETRGERRVGRPDGSVAARRSDGGSEERAGRGSWSLSEVLSIEGSFDDEAACAEVRRRTSNGTSDQMYRAALFVCRAIYITRQYDPGTGRMHQELGRREIAQALDSDAPPHCTRTVSGRAVGDVSPTSGTRSESLRAATPTPFSSALPAPCGIINPWPGRCWSTAPGAALDDRWRACCST